MSLLVLCTCWGHQETRHSPICLNLNLWACGTRSRVIPLCIALTMDALWRCLQMSKILSRKYVILYKLCEDLLSKSKHYDWKLRAIKTTLYVAGGMKRSAPDLTEDKVRRLHQIMLALTVCCLLQCPEPAATCMSLTTLAVARKPLLLHDGLLHCAG